MDKKWYPGRVLSYTEAQGATQVVYDDDDVEMLHMIMERHRILPGRLCYCCTQLPVICLGACLLQACASHTLDLMMPQTPRFVPILSPFHPNPFSSAHLC